MTTHLLKEKKGICGEPAKGNRGKVKRDNQRSINLGLFIKLNC